MMKKMENYYKFANHIFKIKTNFDYFHKFAKDYVSNFSESFFDIETTIKEIEDWKKEYDDGNDFPLPYLETLVVQKKIAEKLMHCNVFVMHGSSICFDEENGFIFTAKSGTGKSTHTRLLKEMFGEQIKYINDDKPFISYVNNRYELCGSCWDGKEGLSNNISIPLKGIFLVKRSKVCKAYKILGKDALSFLAGQIHVPNLNDQFIGQDFIIKLCKDIPIYVLEVDMSSDAPKTSYEIMKELSKKEG